MGDAVCSRAVQYQPSCSWCELMWVVLKHVIVEMEVWKRDLNVRVAVIDMIQEIARQQSEVGVVVKHWLDFFLPLSLPKVGTKRGSRDPRMFQEYVNKCCAISILHGASKKFKFVGPGPDPLRYEASTTICYKNDVQYISGDMIEEFSSLESLDSTPLGDTSCKSVASGILSSLFRLCLSIVGNRRIVGDFQTRNSKIVEVPERVLEVPERVVEVPERVVKFPERVLEVRERVLEVRERVVEVPGRVVEVRERVVEVPERVETPTMWGSLPIDLHENILKRVELKDLFRFKTLSRSCKEYIESEAFRKCRGGEKSSKSEGLFTAINYHIKDKQWRLSGFDLSARMWKHLPSLSLVLPAPDPELFKEYTVCGHDGLICADIAKLPEKGQLVVLNPLTQKKRELPPLLCPRSPVLIHMWVDSASVSKFKVIVAGSSVSSDEKLSRKIEVFDSETSVWEAAPDLPGPAFGLNEHQVGVCVDGVLHFISFLDSGSGSGRGVVAFDLKTRTWLSTRACPIPFSTYSNTLQLVESKGKVCLFSEQERGGSVNHCIDELELVNENWKLRNVVRVKKSGGRGLQVYPEHTCIRFGDEKLCIFNTLTRSGVVYDMKDGKEVEALKPPPFDQKGDNFFSLNPASFVLRPSFGSDPGNNASLGAC